MMFLTTNNKIWNGNRVKTYYPILVDWSLPRDTVETHPHKINPITHTKLVGDMSLFNRQKTQQSYEETPPVC